MKGKPIPTETLLEIKIEDGIPTYYRSTGLVRLFHRSYAVHDSMWVGIKSTFSKTIQKISVTKRVTDKSPLHFEGKV